MSPGWWLAAACRQDPAILPDADGDGVPDVVDCALDDPAVFPGAPEVCDGVDQDCDRQVDEEPADGKAWHADRDGDGFGDPDGTVIACAAPPGWIARARDCADADPQVHPGGAETCDGVDQDCDGLVDEDLPVSEWFADADGDGYGAGDPVPACRRPDDYAVRAGDCDDADSARSPVGDEICGDGVDQDCDGGPGPICGFAASSTGTPDAVIGGPGGAWGGGLGVGPAGDVDGNGIADLWFGGTAGYEEVGVRPGVVDLVLGPIAGFTSATASVRIVGEADGDEFGFAIEGGIDADGDGAVDVLVGGPGAGGVWLLRGPFPADRDATCVDDGLCDGLHLRGTDGSSLGEAVAFVGDLDGDGTVELAAGGSGEAGELWIVSGDRGETLDPACVDDGDCTVYTGSGPADAVGDSVVAAGDLDGDGLDDLLIGATGVGSGAVYVLTGLPDSGPLANRASARLELPSDRVGGGEAVAAADLDGDGAPEIAVGDPEDADGLSGVYLLLSSVPLVGAVDLSADAARLAAPYTEWYTGQRLVAGTDLDHDGLPELAVGAIGADQPQGILVGAVALVEYPWPGGETGLTDTATMVYGAEQLDQLGSALARLGDVDGDGLEDLAVGVGGLTHGAGGVWILGGRPGI